MTDGTQQDDEGLEEGLPTALDAPTPADPTSATLTRGSSPSKRDASHMDDERDVEMREGSGARGEANKQDLTDRLNGRRHARSVSVEMGGVGDQQQTDQTTSASSATSTSSAIVHDSSAATSLGSSPHDYSQAQSATDSGPATQRPSYDEQYSQVLALITVPLSEEGQPGYILSNKWLERVMARTSSPPSDFDKNALKGEVGPVDNTDILPEVGSRQSPFLDEQGKQFIALAPGMELSEHFEILPQTAWDLVRSWYGVVEGTQIPVRYAHSTRDSVDTEFSYELRPPIFTLRKVVAQKTSTNQALSEQESPAVQIMASRSTPIQEFFRVAKQKARISITTKVRIWRDLVASTARPQESRSIPFESASMLTPPPDDALARNDSPLKLIMEKSDFLAMSAPTERVRVDAVDQSNNPKYNGKSKIRTFDLNMDEVLLLEAQISPGKDEYPSDAGSDAVSKRFINSKTGKVDSDSGRASPAPSGPVTRGRARHSKVNLGNVGLGNMGNTCYMNSALQCMRSVEELTRYFTSNKWQSEVNHDNPLGHNGQIARVYAQLMETMFGMNTGSVTPRNFRGVVGKAAPMFGGYTQQDSQEFMSFLLDGLHEDLNRILKKPYTENPESDDKMVNDSAAIEALGEKFRAIHRSRNDSVAMDLFNGFYKNTMVCPECHKVSITFDPYSLLTLQLPFEQTWQHTVSFYPLYGKPIKVEIDIPKGSTFASLKKYVADRFEGVDSKRLIIVELFSNKFYKIFDDSKSIEEESIQARDDIVVYELEAEPTNWPPRTKRARSILGDESETEKPSEDRDAAMLVPVYQYVMNSRNSYSTTKSAASDPFFIVVNQEEATDIDAIMRKLLAKVATMTTKDIFEDDGDQSNLRTKANGSDPEQTTDDDASTESVQARSIEGEGSIVDISMSNDTTNSSSTSADPSGTNPHSALSNVPAIITNKDSYLDPQFTSMFTVKYLPFGRGIIPQNFVSFDSNLKNAPTVESRVPEPSASGPRRASNASSASTRSQGSESETDQPTQPAMSFQEVESGDDELPSAAKLNAMGYVKRQKGRMKSIKKKPRTYGRNGKAATTLRHYDSTQEDGEEDNPKLIRLGEVLFLDWNDEAYRTLFDGDASDEMRGQFARSVAETYDDPALREKRQRRKARRDAGVTLDDCFNETAKSEILSEDNKWYCNRCKELRRASKTLEIWTLPDILVIHLKRFGSGGGFRNKIDSVVDFPIEGLDLNNRAGVSMDKDATYDLIAVDNHAGGLGGGHYTAYCKNFIDGKWYNYNDSFVSTVSDPTSVITSQAYLLFYRRRSSQPLGPSYLQKLVWDANNTGEDADVDSTSKDGSTSQTNSRATSPSGQGKGRLGASYPNGSPSVLAGAGAGRRAINNGAGAGSLGAAAANRAKTVLGTTAAGLGQESQGAADPDDVLPGYEDSNLHSGGGGFIMQSEHHQPWSFPPDDEGEDAGSDVAALASSIGGAVGEYDQDQRMREDFGDDEEELEFHSSGPHNSRMEFIPSGASDLDMQDDEEVAEVRLGEEDELKMD